LAHLAAATGDAGIAARGRHGVTVRQAAVVAWADGLGHGHTLCHGALGTWELLAAAPSGGVAPPAWTVPPGLDRRTLDAWVLDARVLGGLERAGPTGSGDVIGPGPLTGLGGIVHQLPRMHPDFDLLSLLLLGDCRRVG